MRWLVGKLVGSIERVQRGFVKFWVVRPHAAAAHLAFAVANDARWQPTASNGTHRWQYAARRCAQLAGDPQEGDS